MSKREPAKSPFAAAFAKNVPKAKTRANTDRGKPSEAAGQQKSRPRTRSHADGGGSEVSSPPEAPSARKPGLAPSSPPKVLKDLMSQKDMSTAAKNMSSMSHAARRAAALEVIGRSESGMNSSSSAFGIRADAPSHKDDWSTSFPFLAVPATLSVFQSSYSLPPSPVSQRAKQAEEERLRALAEKEERERQRLVKRGDRGGQEDASKKVAEAARRAKIVEVLVREGSHLYWSCIPRYQHRLTDHTRSLENARSLPFPYAVVI